MVVNKVENFYPVWYSILEWVGCCCGLSEMDNLIILPFVAKEIYLILSKRPLQLIATLAV